ncbi:PilN domain-containing protein [Massilia norwichensis]|uniref:PilN domain-containing protein n=1 Tax=Massilia norwichensis TaxID=1442366 RepID=A0ABT2A5J8_9BURK|nr:PilN domain-containing protein [Massilia norwichensis]MCS0589375.1 PilN domain-containing protein [Massilia norwichensis]
MRKVNIDFAPPGVARSILRMPRQGWALLFAVLAAAMALLAASSALRREQGEVALLRAQGQAQARAATQAQAEAAPVAVRAPVPEAQANAVNAAVLQLNLPWRALHDAVQAGTPANIALLALEPDARKSTVRITAEAKSSEDMIAYVEQLQKDAWFSAVVLARHEINEQDPNRPIRFQLDARWRPAQ